MLDLYYTIFKIILFILILKSSSVYCYDSNSTIYNDKPRIAIIISGQLRSGNLTWKSGYIRNNEARRMFGDDDPQSPILTQLEWIFKPLSKTHYIDAFFYIQAHPDTKLSDWDGQPESFQPIIGNTIACEPYIMHDLFSNKSSGNQFFCLVEEEIQLMTTFLSQNPMWESYTYTSLGPHMQEQVLQQYYGMYRGNLAAKQYALANNVSYEYKLRLRPDIAIVKPFPELLSLPFGGKEGICKSTILYANKIIYKPGCEDFFNIGKTEDMDFLLDRYLDFISSPFIRSSTTPKWDLEHHLLGLLQQRYNICMEWFPEIWIVVIRTAIHHHNSWLPKENTMQWKKIN